MFRSYSLSTRYPGQAGLQNQTTAAAIPRSRLQPHQTQRSPAGSSGTFPFPKLHPEDGNSPTSSPALPSNFNSSRVIASLSLLRNPSQKTVKPH